MKKHDNTKKRLLGEAHEMIKGFHESGIVEIMRDLRKKYKANDTHQKKLNTQNTC
jgi:hypothetical protein